MSSLFDEVRYDERQRVAIFLERKAKESRARIMAACQLSDPAARGLQKQVADKVHDVLMVVAKMTAEGMLEERGSAIPGIDIDVRQVL